MTLIRILFVGVYKTVRSHSLEQVVERLVKILRIITFIDISTKEKPLHFFGPSSCLHPLSFFWCKLHWSWSLCRINMSFCFILVLRVTNDLVSQMSFSFCVSWTLFKSNIASIFSIGVWTTKNAYININTSLVQVRRPNYPSNCYTLDLAEHEEVKNVGVKKLFIQFWPKKNSSLKILLEDKSLACNRTIKFHKFFFSGKNVKIVDLGKIDKQTVQY